MPAVVVVGYRVKLLELLRCEERRADIVGEIAACQRVAPRTGQAVAAFDRAVRDPRP